MPDTSQRGLDPIRLNNSVKQLIISDDARNHSELNSILERAEKWDIHVENGPVNTNSDSINQRFRQEKRILQLDVNKGSFIKPWESDGHLVGDDEWCLTPVEGCPLDCSYCYLQDYLERPLVTAFVNQNSMKNQLKCFLEDPPQRPPYFFSLGELSDGLFLEPLLQSISQVWDVFRGRDSATLEIRTKSHHVHGLPDRITPHEQGVFTWSLSPEDTAQSEEMLTASLDQRFRAMKYLSNAGFNVAVRVDPIIYSENWRQQYRDLVDSLFRTIRPEELEFLILGTFRFPHGFDKTMEERFPNRDYLREEFVQGPDGKYRYPRSLRTRVFETFTSWLESHGVNPDLCMEPNYVWEDVDYELDEKSSKHA